MRWQIAEPLTATPGEAQPLPALPFAPQQYVEDEINLSS
jgi:hypothetical protein